MNDNHDQCQYNRCYFPLGEWVPVNNFRGFAEAEQRVCEKCGGKQWRAIITDEKMIKDVESIFGEYKEKSNDQPK